MVRPPSNRKRTLQFSLLAVGVVAAGVVFLLFFAPQSSKRVDEAAAFDVTDAPPLKSGSFAGADAAHDVSGSVSLHRVGEQTLLRLSDYHATDGPDVFFYLTKGEEFDPKRAIKVPVPQSAQQGQATVRGNFSVPVDGAASDYDQLVVWCERFNVEFGRAPLK